MGPVVDSWGSRMTATLQPAAAADNSAGTGCVVRALAPRLGLKPNSCHQHMQRIRRELPIIVRTGIELGRQAWIDWLFALADMERMGPVDLSAGLAHVFSKGTVDRTEDGAREAYLHRQDLGSAREFDARLEKEQIAIAATRRFLRARHPELRTC